MSKANEFGPFSGPTALSADWICGRCGGRQFSPAEKAMVTGRGLIIKAPHRRCDGCGACYFDHNKEVRA